MTRLQGPTPDAIKRFPRFLRFCLIPDTPPAFHWPPRKSRASQGGIDPNRTPSRPSRHSTGESRSSGIRRPGWVADHSLAGRSTRVPGAWVRARPGPLCPVSGRPAGPNRFTYGWARDCERLLRCHGVSKRNRKNPSRFLRFVRPHGEGDAQPFRSLEAALGRRSRSTGPP